MWKAAGLTYCIPSRTHAHGHSRYWTICICKLACTTVVNALAGCSAPSVYAPCVCMYVCMFVFTYVYAMC